jgi:hypothetical protein
MHARDLALFAAGSWTAALMVMALGWPADFVWGWAAAATSLALYAGLKKLTRRARRRRRRWQADRG